MKNWLNKVLSLLTAIALLVSAGALAFAEENAEPIDAAAEAAAQQAAAEAAAQQAAEEAAAAEAAARQAAEEAAAQQADPIPSYNNEEIPEADQDPDDADDSDDLNDSDVIYIDDFDFGHTDPEQREELGLNMTDEVIFADAVNLYLNKPVSGSVDETDRAEFLFIAESSMTIVLGLEASSEAVNMTINGNKVRFTKIAGTENEAGLNGICELTLTEGKYDIVLSSSYSVYYTLTVMDTAAALAKTEAPAGEKEVPADVMTDENNGNDENEEENKDSNEDTAPEGIEGTNNENNKNPETTEDDIPVLKGWITTNAEAFEIGDVITLKAESDAELGDMVLWQTKVRNEDGEIIWQNLGYGATLEVELTEENIANTYRFRMEYDNYSDEFTLIQEGSKETEETEPEEENETAEGSNNSEEADVCENGEMDPTEGIDIGFVSTLDFGGVAMGETCVMNAKVEKLEGYEIGSFNWYYSPDAGETWIRIEDADSSCYEYVMSNDNWYYLWKVEVSVLTETETAE